ncbi:hypothetical protein, partial [Microbacterium sp. OVT16B]|uniref:hypothetical protein n=1 Tax=Microbacterium sp. OVT16B TaxID=2862682 RepID=UPI001CBFE7A3
IDDAVSGSKAHPDTDATFPDTDTDSNAPTGARPFSEITGAVTVALLQPSRVCPPAPVLIPYAQIDDVPTGNVTDSAKP